MNYLNNIDEVIEYYEEQAKSGNKDRREWYKEGIIKLKQRKEGIKKNAQSAEK